MNAIELADVSVIPSAVVAVCPTNRGSSCCSNIPKPDRRILSQCLLSMAGCFNAEALAGLSVASRWPTFIFERLVYFIIVLLRNFY